MQNDGGANLSLGDVVPRKMENLLFVDAAVRTASRTRSLCQYLLNQVLDRYHVCQLRLRDENLLPLNAEEVERRNILCAAGEFEDPIFAQAKLMHDADFILIGAPYWDLSFPAMLKVFFERASVCGVTFRYASSGLPQGLCHAKHLVYLTSSGGWIGDKNYGYDYVRALAAMFGIQQTDCIACEGLDIAGIDVPEQMLFARQRVDRYIRMLGGKPSESEREVF